MSLHDATAGEICECSVQRQGVGEVVVEGIDEFMGVEIVCDSTTLASIDQVSPVTKEDTMYIAGK